jgi:hypothetical protein
LVKVAQWNHWSLVRWRLAGVALVSSRTSVSVPVKVAPVVVGAADQVVGVIGILGDEGLVVGLPAPLQVRVAQVQAVLVDLYIVAVTHRAIPGAAGEVVL